MTACCPFQEIRSLLVTIPPASSKVMGAHRTDVALTSKRAISVAVAGMGKGLAKHE